MKTRELPVHEWDRLKATGEHENVLHLEPRNTRVLVVEDEEGKIAGVWVMIRVMHAEGVWIDPKHRNGYGVAARLIKGMRAIGHDWSMTNAWTGSTTPEVAALVERLDGLHIPFDHYSFPVDKRANHNAV